MNPFKFRRDQRREPRLPARPASRRINAEIGGVHAYTSNISKSGAQIVCPALLFRTLRPQLESGGIEVNFTVRGALKITATAKVRYLCPSDDEILIGLELLEFAAGHEDVWLDYIERANGDLRLAS